MFVLKLRCALFALLAGLPPSLLQAETHVDISFADYPKEDLPVGASTPWRISAVEEGAVTTVIEEQGGVTALRLKSTANGGLSFSTKTDPAWHTKSLAPHPGSTIEWTFDWKIPEDVDPQGRTTLIRLEDGRPSAGHFLAGFGLTRSGLAVLTDPNVEPTAQQMTTLDSVRILLGTWYRTTFVLQISADKEITSTMTIREKEEVLHTTSATYTPFELQEDGIIRMIISVSEGTDLFIGRFQISSQNETVGATPSPQLSEATSIPREDLPQELTEAMKKEPVSLQAGDLLMRFYPEKAWTFRSIKVGGKELTQYQSWTGLVLRIDAPGEWIGTGHREAGTEQVKKVVLLVDGREEDPFEGGHFTGQVIELIKESTIANALTLKTTFRLDHGKLITRQEVEVVQDIEIKLLYAFMYPWTEETTFWMAKLLDGEVIEGDFSRERIWELRKDVEWTAIYHPQAQLVAWVGYAQGSREGGGVKHGFWNMEKRYHKQYYQPLSNAALNKGQKFDWQSEVRFLPASEDEWRKVARAQE